jgi:DNA polymerase-3 subunit delta'|tara:strand:+ start:164 stop:1093 length:930 start_codon:yes stop_codon:yes gene_type:complete
MNLDPSNQLDLFAYENYLLELTKLYLDHRLPNKILLSGEKGIGKSTLGYHLINFILSQKEEFSYDSQNLRINPKNKSFILMQNKSNPNFILLDLNEEKKNIDINQIRNLNLILNKSSFDNRPRLVLIDNIELLNINAVNALLKVLEEPNDNIYFILINNNKKILPTLKSRCLNFKIQLTAKQSFDITNKLLNDDYSNLINNEITNNYSTPGEILRLINFANNNDIELKEISLKQFIKKIIMDKKYKKDNYIKELIYSLIEIYFRNNVSINNIKLSKEKIFFQKKINNTKIFNLDEESVFIEFEERVLNG